MRDIVILSHADQPDYGDLDGRIEGVTIFAPSGIFDDLSPLHDICNQFVNVKSISLPSLWLREHRVKLMRLINELHDYQGQANDCPIFYGALAELHVCTGKSDDVVSEEKEQKKTSRELVKGGLPPLELLADHSMQFYRDTLGKKFCSIFPSRGLTNILF